MDKIKDAAVGFEAVMVSMAKTKDGTKMVLVVHHDDDVSGLFARHIGTRYQVALVELDDQNQPVTKKVQTDPDGEAAVAAAGILCRSQDFQNWVARTSCSIFPANEGGAVGYLLNRCGITSRKDLAGNAIARGIFHSIRKEYNDQTF